MQNPDINKGIQISRRNFLAMTAAAVGGAVVPNPNLSVQLTEVAVAQAAVAPCGNPFENKFANLTSHEQAAVQLQVNRVTQIVDRNGQVVETKDSVPAVGNDYLLENAQNRDQRVVATIKDVDGVGVAKEIVRRRQPDGGWKNTAENDTFVFTGYPDGTRRLGLVCDDKRYEIDAPSINVIISRYEGPFKPATYVTTLASAVRCHPAIQRLTSNPTEPAPEPTKTPEPTPVATPSATPEKGNQAPVPTGNQAPLSETDPSLGDQYGIVSLKSAGQDIRVIEN